ncbi:hypothetical protein N865_02930 [Intrasporangium oryzae NRRL B-24470]|uniref:Ferric siderophore reductase C-terminal domain-containing protein n=1 Tax=Intrasporangium oryzae NRRL B-24470 TaxID=1386089 RepID=W9GG49_9MICO|nr:(2Fe-2S)-binding protein [Intrasporangium oryzae]EWT02854.1 hypothetical protein N865_02930 [Intrasporangium oryzae NRRL B-24470]
MERSGIEDVLHRVDQALPFVTVATRATPATVSCAEVLAHVRAGHDPLAPWRTALRSQMERRHATRVAPHVPAAFVLQWWCEVAATPIAYAAGLGPWVLLPDPEGLGFELALGLHPQRVVVDPDRAPVEVDPSGERRSARARAAYDSIVSEVVEAYAPEVKMSSRQRWGVVDDVWATAVRGARGAAGETVGGPPRRVSCCFIYALPGMRACTPCPRGART